MAGRVSCPYCNATTELGDVPASGRVSCSRCGEAFPVKHSPAALNGQPAGPYPAPPTAAPPVARAFVPLALIGLLLGSVVLGGGLYAILRTKPTPPSDTGTPATGKPPAVFPPAAVPGLQYLPAETNVAFAVQPGPLLASAERTGTDPQKLLASVGIPDRVTATLAQLGLTLARIDHLAGGAVVDDKSPLRVVLVLALRSPHPDEAAFLKALTATKPADSAVPGHYRVQVSGVPADMVKAGDRTYVLFLVGVDPKDPAGVANPARSGVPVPLKESVAKLSPASVAWVATASEAWAEKKTVAAVAQILKQPDIPKRLAPVRAVAAGLSLEPDPRLGVLVRGKDADAVAELNKSLDKLFGDKSAVTTEADWVGVAGPVDASSVPDGWLKGK